MHQTKHTGRSISREKQKTLAQVYILGYVRVDRRNRRCKWKVDWSEMPNNLFLMKRKNAAANKNAMNWLLYLKYSIRSRSHKLKLQDERFSLSYRKEIQRRPGVYLLERCGVWFIESIWDINFQTSSSNILWHY